VLIADDHAIVRSGLRRTFEEEPDLVPAGEVSTVDALLVALRSTASDVLILDVNMPGATGAHTVTKINEAPNPPRIVVFTMYNEDSHAIAYLRAGASAFICKKRSPRVLVEAIRKVHAGGRYITPELADYLFEQQIDVSRPAMDLLSPRELEVVRTLAGGHRATEVAQALALSTSTVNTYVHRIKCKLGVHTVLEIVEAARENGLLG